MPRTIWSGAISFGLVTVPINVVSATGDHSVRFHQYHLEDMGRVRVRKFCETEDREVFGDEIGKGYQLTKERVVPISDDELSSLPLPTAKAIEIEAFVPLQSVDPIRIGEGYYLQPSGQAAAKPYKLLRQALSGRRRSLSPSTPEAGGSVWACSGSATTSSFCTRCAGRTRSATPPSSCRRRWR
ncbi:non-homologous end joining protein Ku [Streptomyces werraensis]